jgi:hypothetical protein
MVSRNFIPAVFIEFYPEYTSKFIEMIEFGISGVIAHQQQYASGLNPV